MAELYTPEDVLAHWKAGRSQKAMDEEAEVEQIERDLDTATKFLNDAIDRYRKKKLRAKSKAAATTKDPFAEIAEYGSRTEIQDAYGWGFITESRMDYLLNLWDVRTDQAQKQAVPYTDGVTEMLERAKGHFLSAEQDEKLTAYYKKCREMRAAAEQIAKENIDLARARTRI